MEKSRKERPMKTLREEKSVNSSYTSYKNMYHGARTHVKTRKGDIETFLMTIGLHQGFTQNPYLFVCPYN